MNKELTPLEALAKIKQITSTVEQGFSIKLKDDTYYENELKVIETALKESERLKTSYLENLLNEESKEYIYKKLKALEIIKKRLEYFIDCDESTKTIYIDGAIDCDKQEYNLLKEVLL